MIPINDLVLDLSKMLFDQRSAIGESDANHDYTQALLVLAINRAVRDLLNALYEKEDVDGIIKAMPEYVTDTALTPISLQADMPTDAYKGISLKAWIPAGGDEVLAIYVSPDKWYAVQEGYNTEEVGNNTYPRWTEYDRIIRLNGIDSPQITYQYIKNYTDIAIGGNITVNAKYYNQILDLAYAFIMKLSPIQ